MPKPVFVSAVFRPPAVGAGLAEGATREVGTVVEAVFCAETGPLWHSIRTAKIQTWARRIEMIARGLREYRGTELGIMFG
jgi:hypothetical protein